MSDLKLCEIKAENWKKIELIGDLRKRAWHTEVSTDLEMPWLDEFDRASRHWAFLQDNHILAAARLSIHSSITELPYSEDYTGVFTTPPPDPIGSLNWLVVDPSVRGMGLANKLDLIRVEAAQEIGCRCVVGAVISGERRIRQMKKIGFVVFGTGSPITKKPWCDLPSPIVLVCHLPRNHT